MPLSWIYHCPECETVWESDSPSSTSEWCPNCSSIEEPELLEVPF